MNICKICCKEFKYKWCLERHLRRKTPCKEKTIVDQIGVKTAHHGVKTAHHGVKTAQKI